MYEEKWKDRAGGGNNANDTTATDAAMISGLRDRGGLCISPELMQWLSAELQKESAVLKERRKAREERTLARPKAGAAGH